MDLSTNDGERYKYCAVAEATKKRIDTFMEVNDKRMSVKSDWNEGGWAEQQNGLSYSVLFVTEKKTWEVGDG